MNNFDISTTAPLENSLITDGWDKTPRPYNVPDHAGNNRLEVLGHSPLPLGHIALVGDFPTPSIEQ